VAHPGRGQQVALVARVDVHPGAEDLAVLRAQRGDPAVLDVHFGQPVFPVHVDRRHPLVEHPLRHVRLEGERLRLAVVRARSPVELPGQPADRVDPTGVGGAEAGRGQPAEMPAEHHEHHRPAGPGGPHRGDDPGRRPAVDADVAGDLARRGRHRVPVARARHTAG
jgi:hypothetical protein